MKNYIVKAMISFNDTAEKNEMGGDTPRTAGLSVWNCTKERYEFLKSRNAVTLVGIEEIKEEKVEVEDKKEVETKPKKSYKSKKK